MSAARWGTKEEYIAEGKRELATRIAVALFPEEFWVDSPAVQGEVMRQMKRTMKDLRTNVSALEAVEAQRKMEKSFEEEVEVGTALCPLCYAGCAVVLEETEHDTSYFSDCCYGRVDSTYISFDFLK